MAPEDNSKPSSDTTPNNDQADQSSPVIHDFSEPTLPSITPEPAAKPSINRPTSFDDIKTEDSAPLSSTTQTEVPTSSPSLTPTDSDPQPSSKTEPEKLIEATSTPDPVMPSKPVASHKSHLKAIIVVVVLILLFAASITGAFLVGKQKRIVVQEDTAQSINLPASAIVTAACVPGRGKQYIIPKDIPVGPIYDVENSKVIAIEYLINVEALLENPNSFSTTLLLLTKNYQVNHFDIIPVAPTSGQNGENIHLIMFVVSKSVANSITCSGKTSS